MADPPSRYGSIRMIRAPQDAAAGLFLVALCAFALWQTNDLDVGTLGHLGPGMAPRALAVLTGLCGLALFIFSFFDDGPALERWSMRGPICILGAAVVFGLTIRPLGLMVAGPLSIILGALASRDTHWLETLIFGIAMTAFCLLLFRGVLNLPIPVAPWLLDY